jgi:hypothetical protein
VNSLTVLNRELRPKLKPAFIKPQFAKPHYGAGVVANTHVLQILMHEYLQQILMLGKFLHAATRLAGLGIIFVTGNKQQWIQQQQVMKSSSCQPFSC